METIKSVGCLQGQMLGLSLSETTLQIFHACTWAMRDPVMASSTDIGVLYIEVIITIMVLSCVFMYCPSEQRPVTGENDIQDYIECCKYFSSRIRMVDNGMHLMIIISILAV